MSTDAIKRIWSGQLFGVDCQPVEVSGTYARGYGGIKLIGHFSPQFQSCLARITAVLDSMMIDVNERQVLLSFSPADLLIEGHHHDLSIALLVTNIIKKNFDLSTGKKILYLGEITLDGTLKRTKGIIPIVLAAVRNGFHGIVCSHENVAELSVLKKLLHREDFQITTYKNIRDVFDAVKKRMLLQSTEYQFVEKEINTPTFADMDMSPDLMDMAQMIAIGKHSLLMMGSPGVGKTMFAKRIISLLPPLDRKDHLQALSYYSQCGDVIEQNVLAGAPPLRMPHHHTTSQAMIGRPDSPGEISLAHGGILFLDEFPEFRRDVLESLREPLESGTVSISRAIEKIVRPVNFVLIAAANPCQCGWYGSSVKKCRCGGSALVKYQQRFSGPILDRIDLRLELYAKKKVSTFKRDPQKFECFIQKTLEAQQFSFSRKNRWNRDIPASELMDECKLSQTLWENFSTSLLGLSSRGVTRLLRVARSVADSRLQDDVTLQDLEKAKFLTKLPQFYGQSDSE